MPLTSSYHVQTSLSRTSRFLQTLTLAAFISTVFCFVFLRYYIDYHVAEHFNSTFQCQPQETVAPWKSFHIDEELSRRLQSLWLELKTIQRPPDEKYKLNVTLSDATSFDRVVPVTRNSACENIQYNEDVLPNLSAIIPFFNEPLSMILRTVHSILNRTPARLLDQIILVDDASDYENLGQPLELYLGHLPKVVLIRNTVRQGLIRTRMKGLEAATGDVVIFQDAHTEVGEGWAQPILYHLKRFPKHLIQPAIDNIMFDTLYYQSSFNDHIAQITSFAWDLRYIWTDSPPRIKMFRRSMADPVPTPTIVGCAIAVNRKSFIEMGAFDDKMNIWGGENLEVPIRYWQCGGAVLTHPCSRVGHLYKPIPYSFGNTTADQVVTQNLARFAEVWMDNFKEIFYATTWMWEQKRFNFTEQFITEVQERRHVTRDRLQCKSFGWFLKTVAAEVKPPPPAAVWFGEITSTTSKKVCFDLLPCGHIALVPDCGWETTRPSRHFFIDHRGLLHFFPKQGTCITVEKSTGLLVSTSCKDPEVGRGRFLIAGPHNGGKLMYRHIYSDRVACASQVTYSGEGHFHYNDRLVQMLPCSDQENDSQGWFFTYKFDHQNMPPML